MRRLSIVCVVATLAHALITAAIAPVSARSAGDSSVYRARHAQTRSRVLSFWTKERMRRARPLMPTLTGDSFSEAPRFFGDSGEPRVIAPTSPHRSFATSTLGSTIPYTSEEVSDTTAFPAATHGKVFLEFGSFLYVCSGTIVTSANESVVWTAGHCVYDPATGKFAKNWMFMPGYRFGDEPLGRWTADQLFTTSGWAQTSSFEFDFGAAVVGEHGGATIEEEIGSRGISFNLPREQTFEAFGYPAAPPFDGQREYMCTSETGMSLSQGPGPDMLGIGCNMTQGSSGGGWVVNSSSVDSVVSAGSEDLPGVFFGPYQGSAAEQLYNEASGDEAPPPPVDDPVTHRMNLTMRLSGSLVARGMLTANDGYSSCRRGMTVGIFRQARTGFKLIKVVTTNDSGAYRAKIPDRKGKYAAYSPQAMVDDLNKCSESTSVVRRRRG